MKNVLVPALLLALMSGQASSAEPAAIAALRARFPQGIPWMVKILDAAGQSLGSLEVRITSTQASSCLGDMNPGVQVDFVRKELAPANLPIAFHGVARFRDDTVKIDLTGGTCDAYSIMEGKIEADGSSTGDVFRFGMWGSTGIGTYRATVQ